MKDGINLSRRTALIGSAGLIGASLVPQLASPALARAPKLGVSMPTHFRFALGEFEITTVLDGAVQLDGPHPIFGENQPEEVVRKFAAENLLPETRMEISFTPLIVNTGAELVLFDTGNGGTTNRRPNAGLLASRLAAAGYKPEDITIVVITHCHGDHIGGLMEDGKPAFPNARYVIGQAEYDFWTDMDRLASPVAAAADLVQKNLVPLAEKTSFIKPDGEVTPGIRAVDAFGHTPGHMAYHIESAGKRFLIWADLTNHWVMSLERPDWHLRFDMDKDKAVAARKRILDMAATDRIPVTGYHMPFPAVGFVMKKDGSYRWVQATYQLRI
jgi:glyoxylase-like metal-dependent hydrolase (beta-lactamase superfamily II)